MRDRLQGFIGTILLFGLFLGARSLWNGYQDGQSRERAAEQAAAIQADLDADSRLTGAKVEVAGRTRSDLHLRVVAPWTHFDAFVEDRALPLDAILDRHPEPFSVSVEYLSDEPVNSNWDLEEIMRQIEEMDDSNEPSEDSN